MAVPDQQHAIVQAALGLLASGGPQALRVRDIADAAGCTTMTVYSRFGGKDGVVEAIYVDGFTRFAEQLQGAATGSIAERLQRLSTAYRSWALANPGSYKVMFTEAVPGFSPSSDAALVAFSSFQVLVDAVAARSDESTDQAAIDIAWVLWGVVHGLVMLELAGIEPVGAGSTANHVFDTAVARIIDGLDLAV